MKGLVSAEDTGLVSAEDAGLVSADDTDLVSAEDTCRLPKSFWGLIGVAVRDGEPILCEDEATPLGVFDPKTLEKSREIQ